MKNAPLSFSRPYIYYAFISYSHRDEQWAKWVQNALESYKLPNVIARQHGNAYPKRLHPIFRDASDLSVGKLINNLHHSLDASRYLIVICSPNSAKPNSEGINYVDEEVRYFASLGCEEQIIPVIIDGTPQEAFPPKIRELGLIALDATKTNRRRILNDIVAKILSLRPDELWKRAERRHHRNVLLSCIAIFVSFVLTLLCVIYQYDIRKTHIEYYADYVEQYCVPKGIFPLFKEMIETRPGHYRFIYKGRNGFLGERILREVCFSNSSENATEHVHREHLDRPSILRLTYDEKNQATGIRVFSKSGKELFTKQFSGRNNVCIDFSKATEDEVLFAFTLPKDMSKLSVIGFETSGKSRIGRYRMVYDDNGWCKRVYYRIRGCEDSAADGNGIFGLEFKRDEIGRVKELRYLNRDGSYQSTKHGITGKRYSYDTFGNLYLVERIDSQGNPISNKESWASCEFVFDGGLCQSLLFKNCNGNPALNEDGWSYAEFTYDFYGNQIKEERFDIDKKTRAAPGLFGSAGWEREYDFSGNVIIETEFDCSWMPTLNKRFAYDSQGNTTRFELWHGKREKPEWHYEWTGMYDSFGNIMEETIFDSSTQQSQRKKFTYDFTGNLIKEEWVDANKNTRILNHAGNSGWERTYDSFGNIIEETFFDLSWQPTRSKGTGYAHAKRAYDSRGNQIKEEWFDVDKKTRLQNRFGYSGWERTYDSFGNITEETFFDDFWNPICSKETGYAYVKRTYDSDGYQTKEEYFDSDKKTRVFAVPAHILSNLLDFLTSGKKDQMHAFEKYAGWERTYDSLGNVISETYFNTQWNPINSSDNLPRLPK